MEVKELRIGNWVLLDWENVYRKVNVNVLAYISRSEKINKIHPFKPITLTEEILLKCGFEKDLEDSVNNNIDYILNNCEYWIQYHEDVNNFIFFGGGNSLGIKLNYLHQLQNLYFALTGKELEVEL